MKNKKSSNISAFYSQPKYLSIILASLGLVLVFFAQYFEGYQQGLMLTLVSVFFGCGLGIYLIEYLFKINMKFENSVKEVIKSLKNLYPLLSGITKSMMNSTDPRVINLIKKYNENNLKKSEISKLDVSSLIEVFGNLDGGMREKIKIIEEALSPLLEKLHDIKVEEIENIERVKLNAARYICSDLENEKCYYALMVIADASAALHTIWVRYSDKQ